MHLRPFRSLFAFSLTSLSLLALAAAAHAGGAKGKGAMQLADPAMDEDLLSGEFAKAEKKLNEALKKCGKDGCSNGVLGKLHIALGTVHGGNGKLDLAKEEFGKALQVDPKAALNDSLTTPELKKAYDEAKKSAGKGGDGGDKGEGGDGGDGGEKPGKKEPKGDIPHTPPAEQAVNTPVPVYVEIPEEVGAEKVTLKYKPFGAKQWKTAEMKPIGDGWGAEIPCEDVTTTGDIKYYIIAKDAAGDPAATAGSLKDPYKVPIKNDIEGDPPSLPGKKAPDACAAKEDCPPGLPGCPNAGGKRGDKGWGASCEQTQECSAGLVCLNGSCEEGKDDGSDGGGKPGGKGKKNLVGLFGQVDLMLISGAENVCSGDDPAYACFYPSDTPDVGGTQFYGNPATKAGTNGISGGFGIGGARVMLAFDRTLLESVGLGAGLRVGYAFGGSPSSDTAPPGGTSYPPPLQAKSFLPVHAEARAIYSPLGGFEEKKIRPFVFAGGGIAQVNASVPVTLCDKATYKGDDIPFASRKSGCPADEPSNTGSVPRELEAYQITGLGFVGVGAGATYGLTSSFGVAAELKVMFMVPTFGVVFAPTIGPVFAF